jgi:hypothetical protein
VRHDNTNQTLARKKHSQDNANAAGLQVLHSVLYVILQVGTCCCTISEMLCLQRGMPVTMHMTA